MTELLPTPPLPDATARMRVVAGISVSGALSRACQRALGMTSVRSSGVISPQSMLTEVDAGWVADRGLHVLLDLGAQRAAGDGELHRDGDGAVGVDGDARTMPRSTMLPPSSGSITPRSRFATTIVGGRPELAR